MRICVNKVDINDGDDKGGVIGIQKDIILVLT